MVFVTSGFRGNSLKAIRLADAKGDITGTPARSSWTLDRDTPYVPSPLLYDGILYFLKTNNGMLSAFDAKTGKPHYQVQRLEGVPNVFASPVGAAGRVYIAGRDGTTVVLKHGPSSKCSPSTRSTTASMRRRRWWTGRSTCRGVKLPDYSIGNRRQLPSSNFQHELTPNAQLPRVLGIWQLGMPWILGFGALGVVQPSESLSG